MQSITSDNVSKLDMRDLTVLHSATDFVLKGATERVDENEAFAEFTEIVDKLCHRVAKSKFKPTPESDFKAEFGAVKDIKDKAGEPLRNR